MQKETDFTWVNKVIFSCTNSFQLACCLVLCERFKAMYDDKDLHTQLLVSISEQESKWSITT
jgi:hypothetical protein